MKYICYEIGKLHTESRYCSLVAYFFQFYNSMISLYKLIKKFSLIRNSLIVIIETIYFYNVNKNNIKVSRRNNNIYEMSRLLQNFIEK